MTILLLTHSYPDTDNSWRGSFIRDQAVALSSDNKVIVVYFKIDYNHFAPFAKPYFSKTITGNLTEYTLVVKRSFPIVNQANYLIKTYRFLNKEIFRVSSPTDHSQSFVLPGRISGNNYREAEEYSGSDYRTFEDNELFQEQGA